MAHLQQQLPADGNNGERGAHDAFDQLPQKLRPGEFEAIIPRVDGSLCLQVQMLRIVNGIPITERGGPLVDIPEVLPPNTPVQALTSAPVVVGYTTTHLGRRSPIETTLDLHAGDVIIGVNGNDLRTANKEQIQSLLGPQEGENAVKMRVWRPWSGEWKWQGLGQPSQELLNQLRSRGFNPDAHPANHLLSIRVRAPPNQSTPLTTVYEYGPCVIQKNDVTGSLSDFARIYDMMVVQVWGWANPRVRFATNFLYALLKLPDNLEKMAGKGVPSPVDNMMAIQHRADDPGSTDGSCSTMEGPCCTVVIQPSAMCYSMWKSLQQEQPQNASAPSMQGSQPPPMQDVPKPALIGTFHPEQVNQLKSQIFALKYLSNGGVPPREVLSAAIHATQEPEQGRAAHHRSPYQAASYHQSSQTQLPSRDRAGNSSGKIPKKKRRRTSSSDEEAENDEETFRASIPSDMVKNRGQRRTSRRSAGRKTKENDDVVSDVSSELYDGESIASDADGQHSSQQSGGFKIERVFGVRYGELDEWKWEDQDPQAAAELQRTDLTESERELLERRRDRAIMQKRLQLYQDENERRHWEKLEYLVKWKGLSYLHVEWVTVSLLKELGRWAIQKARKFAQSDEGHQQLDQEESCLLSLRDPPSIHISGYFDSSFVEVDRIVAKKFIDPQDLDPKEREELEKMGLKSKILYLVKWVALPYSEATWEIADEIQDDEKISQFERNNKPPAPATLQAHPTIMWDERPPPGSWRKYGESQVYKGGRRLREYQVEGLNWLIFNWYNRRSSILADEMGLGKTVQTVAFLEHLRSREHAPGPFLLLAPLSTLGHWKNEIETWTNLNAVVYHDQTGGAAGRALIREYEWFYDGDYGQQLAQRGVYKFNLLLTSYQVLLQDWEYLSRISWRTVVVDEAHALKNAFSQLSTSLRGLDIKHLILLTGTPLQNNVTELWTLLNLVAPRQFPSLQDFVNRYGEMQHQDQVKELLEAVRPILLRRIKTDVEKSLPPKEETIVNVELTNLQKQYYRAVFDKNRSFLTRGAGKIPMANLSNIEMELRKCCNHPYLIEGVEQRETEDLLHKGMSAAELAQEKHSRIVSSSGKMVLLDKLLPKLQKDNHRTLLFSQFSIMLDLLEEYLRWKNIKYERIDGSVRGNARQAAIDRFNSPNSDTTVFLLSTKAGGQGINLTSADTVIIFDSDWNPQNDIQAQARCHRIGQTAEVVRVYRLVTSRTYESEMFRRASKKLGLHQAVFETGELRNAEGDDDEPELTSLLKLDKDKVEALLRYGAYAVMDEDPQKSRSEVFNDADIDTILRNCMTVRYGSDGEIQTAEAGGKVIDAKKDEVKKEDAPSELFHFNKATFASSITDENLDVNDPSFWEKVLGPRPIDTLQRALQEGKVKGLNTDNTSSKAEETESSSEEMSLSQFLADVAALVKDVDTEARQGQRHDDAESIESFLIELKVRGNGIPVPSESSIPSPSFLSKHSQTKAKFPEGTGTCETVDSLAESWINLLSQGPSKRVRSRKRGARSSAITYDDMYGIPTAKPRGRGKKRGKSEPVFARYVIRLRKLSESQREAAAQASGEEDEETTADDEDVERTHDAYQVVSIFDRSSSKDLPRPGSRRVGSTVPLWILHGEAQPSADLSQDVSARASSTKTDEATSTTGASTTEVSTKSSSSSVSSTSSNKAGAAATVESSPTSTTPATTAASSSSSSSA